MNDFEWETDFNNDSDAEKVPSGADASLDIDVRLGVDPRKANQMVRGVVSLPHGTGKQVRVLVLCTPDAMTKDINDYEFNISALLSK